jgi:predicted MPP superfamily phosphohydrolase
MLKPYRKIFAKSLPGWTSVLTTLAVQAFVLEPRQVRASYHRISSNRLRQRIRIVHLTDLHLDGDERRDHVPEMVNHQNPDLILMTGDYLNRSHYSPRLEGFVNQFHSRHGVYASFGNWDVGKQSFLFAKTQVTPLRNSSMEIKVHQDRIRLVGIDYPPCHGATSVLKHPDNGAFNILMHHSPDLIEEVASLGTIDLYLAGHTHGGQVRIPFLKGFRNGFKGRFPYAGALMTFSRFGTKYESGMFKVKDTILYVNRGVGMEGGLAPRVRLFCPPEIGVLDIVPGASFPRIRSAPSQT